MRLTVYSRVWCHLCDDLLAALEPLAARYGVPVDVIDVDSDPALDARFGERVPVVFSGEIELCHYFLDAERVAHALAAHRLTGGTSPPDPEYGQGRPDFG